LPTSPTAPWHSVKFSLVQRCLHHGPCSPTTSQDPGAIVGCGTRAPSGHAVYSPNSCGYSAAILDPKQRSREYTDAGSGTQYSFSLESVGKLWFVAGLSMAWPSPSPTSTYIYANIFSSMYNRYPCGPSTHTSGVVSNWILGAHIGEGGPVLGAAPSVH